MLKVLLVSDSLGSGGAQRQMVSLGIGLKEKGIDVSFLVYHNLNFFKDDLITNDIPVFYINEQNKLKRVLKLRKFIRSGDFDVVQSFLEPVNFACTLASFPTRNWKLIVGERSADPKILKSFKRKAFRWFHLMADYVVSNSHENIKILKRVSPFLSSKKCKVIYNIIDFRLWKAEKDFQFMQNGVVNIAVAASHQYLKNSIGLIKALNKLNPNELSMLKINWYGDESSDSSLKDAKELVRKSNLDNVIVFHNATKQIHHRMADVDVVALFSLYEGLPNAICEGMSLGKVVMSSSVSDVPLLLGNSKYLLFDPSETLEIVKVFKILTKMSKEEMSTLGHNNYNKAKDLFDKETNINKYLKLYK